MRLKEEDHYETSQPPPDETTAGTLLYHQHYDVETPSARPLTRATAVVSEASQPVHQRDHLSYFMILEQMKITYVPAQNCTVLNCKIFKKISSIFR